MNALDFYSVLFEWLWNHVTAWNMYLIQSAGTASALSWLLYRAWKTLWKPVPELISILGVEVPDAPDVSISGIKSTSLDLHWGRPSPAKPVLKYLIQVNGVNVGDLQRSDISITVTGLNPAHYYNVRVIAVGTNNFQSGSSVLRVRTLGRNGRLQVEGCDGSPELLQDKDIDDGADTGNTGGKRSTVGVEVQSQPENSQAMVRERSNGNISTRRNTVSRKHSPSTAGMDQSDRGLVATNEPQNEEELKVKLEGLNAQIREIQVQTANELETFQLQMADLIKARDEKKRILQDNQEVRQQLKDELNECDRLNKDAQSEKQKKEKVLKDKLERKQKKKDDTAKWKAEIQTMMKEREQMRIQEADIEEQNRLRISELQKEGAAHTQTIRGLEEELRQKGLQMKELEAERDLLTGGAQNNEQTRPQDDLDANEDTAWKKAEDELLKKMQTTNRILQEVANSVAEEQLRLETLQANAVMYHANSSGNDFDPNGLGRVRSRRTRTRKSRTNTISIPDATYAAEESGFSNIAPFTSLNNIASPFVKGPYADFAMDHNHGMTEEDANMLIAGAPLSPTATSLLPSNIFADDEPSSPGGDSNGSYGLGTYGGMMIDQELQSPESSRPASRISSPQNSSQNLALYGVSPLKEDNDDRRSLNSPRTEFGAIGTVLINDRSKIRDMFTLSRARGKAATQDDGLALGTLKHGQSQSFPRSLEEPDTSKARRLSFSTGLNWTGFVKRSAITGESSIQGNGPAPARNPEKGRMRRIFGSSIGENNTSSERDPSSPRPPSIASSGPGAELPRPSAEGIFGWSGAPEAAINRNSPLNTNWSAHVPPTWSRNPSRRPSLQHGSSSALNVGVASDDDEFIYPSESRIGHASPPHNVGVIGTRPLSSHKPITPKLNPAAPAFRGLNFNSPSPEPGNEETNNNGKGKAIDSSPTDELSPMPLSSPTASRKSRDTPSLHTQNSIAESYDSLDRASSNALSDAPTPSASSKEKFATRLMRKGSSSKFSLSSSLSSFRTKKTASASTDRTASVERDGGLDEYGEDAVVAGSVTSSPMLGGRTSREFGKGKEGGKEGRMSRNWGMFGMGKGKEKGNSSKEKESEAVERSESELTTEDEG